MGNSLIKLAQRERNHESGEHKSRKRTQTNAENSNELQHLLSSKIFKLNAHCFYEIFDYLSLKDLHSLGLTCKPMQEITAEFFKINYSGLKVYCLNNGIYKYSILFCRRPHCEYHIVNCISLQGFIQSITSIAIENNVRPISYKDGKLEEIKGRDIRFASRFKRVKNCYHRYEMRCNLDKFKYIKLNAAKFKLVKKLSITNVILNQQAGNYISKILPNIEVLELNFCTINQDFYKILLKYCKNVRHIQLIQVAFKKNYKWLLRKYEKLEHLELCVSDISDSTIDELCTFFKLNPNLRSFSCDLLLLQYNENIFLNSKAKLDTFELKYEETPQAALVFNLNLDTDNFYSFQGRSWDLLYTLYTNGFFKHLHLNKLPFFITDLLPSKLSVVSQFLKKLVCLSGPSGNESVFHNLIELACGEILNETQIKSLINVENLYLTIGSFDILLFIVSQLRNLKKIKIIDFKSVAILELDRLNTERENLAGARKVTIYVPEVIYLATKWATKNGNTNLNFIEMKRIGSYDWYRNIYDQPIYFVYPPPKTQCTDYIDFDPDLFY